jgi:3-deoxy-manno-octulosonate cytidylyltransferase (CMP-KDO synthetase)
MIQHVYDRARTCRLLEEIVIATDDDRIRETAEGFGCRVVMTSDRHPSGTDRVNEAVSNTSALHIVNIQGDEPLIRGDSVDRLIEEMVRDPDVGMATLVCKIEDERDLDDRSCVKVVLDRNGDALYFSRSLIPHLISDQQFDFHRHIGIYGYRRDVLSAIVGAEPSSLEMAEGLEQLRALEHGIKIRTVEVDGWGPSVDVPEDISRVEAVLKGG